jgi:hypothetical protein
MSWSAQFASLCTNRLRSREPSGPDGEGQATGQAPKARLTSLYSVGPPRRIVAVTRAHSLRIVAWHDARGTDGRTDLIRKLSLGWQVVDSIPSERATSSHTA